MWNDEEVSMRRDSRQKNLKPSVVAILVLLIIIAAGSNWLHADVTIDLGRGPVTVHTPPTYDPSQPAPLVMLLHGFTLSGQIQEDYFRLLPWSDQLGFLYVFPDGTTDQDGNQFWNATDSCCDFYDSGVDDSGYLRDLIDEIIEQLNVDTERIFLLGHSNGGFMAYRMACDHADVIAAIASLAGATYVESTQCTPSEPVRTVQIHGTVDSLVRYGGGLVFGDGGPYPGAVETTEQWATFNNCSLSPDLSLPPLDLVPVLPGFETTIARYADGCDPGGVSELWTMVQGDHMPNLSLDFNLLVLDFFFSDGDGGGLLTHRQFIPAAAYAAGAEGSFFRTDVDVTNTGDTPGRYRFLWLPRDENNVDPLASEVYTLAAGSGARFTNAVHEVFGLEPDALGAMAIEASSPDFLLLSRIYNLDGEWGSGTFGQAMPAVSEKEMIEGGERRHLVFASQNADYRTNIGCQNGFRSAALINVELFDQQGASLESVNMMMSAWSNEQLDRVFEAHGPVNGRIEVYSPVAGANYYCYASVIDNLTNDPTTILPQ